MNDVRAALPAIAKKLIWDVKYGLLGYPHLEAPEDAVQYLTSHLGQAGDLLELGCGRGALVRALRQAGWKGRYCGVDISARAIKEARKSEDRRNSWIVSDFESFQFPFEWKTIAMIESIYYHPVDTLPGFLNRLASALTEEGTLLIRLHDVEKHHEYLKPIHESFAHSRWVSGNLLCVARS